MHTDDWLENEQEMNIQLDPENEIYFDTPTNLRQISSWNHNEKELSLT